MKKLKGLLLLGCALAASGCTHSKSIDPKTTLQVQLSSEPVSLDPATAEDGVSMRVLDNVMDGLVGYDGGGKLQNRLADSVSISRKGTRYEFHIRPGAKWSDGKAVTPQDFVYGIRRSLSPETAAKLAGMLFPIRGARAFHAGKLGPEALGVRAQGDALVIELEKPASYFLQALTLSVAMPMREDFLRAHQGRWTRETPVTGPYVIARHRIDREILLEPNTHYWAKRSRPSLQVLLRVVQDESTAANLFEQGKLDILTKVPSLDLARFRAKGVLHTDPFLATYFLAFNTRKPPFDRREWRQAVSGAIHRDEIVQAMGSGELPAWSWIPPGLEGYEPFEDPARHFARAMAAVRGQAPSFKGKVTAQLDSSDRNAMILQKIQQDLLKELGLRIELKQLDWKSHVKMLGTDPAPIYRFGWLAPFMDPITHLRAFTSDDPNNYTGWKSAAYDKLVDEIAAMPPGAERERKIRKAEKVLVEDEAVVVPIYHYIQTHAVAARVQGFRVNPFGVIRFEELSLK